MKEEEYKVVRMRIDRTNDTVKIYGLERKRNEVITECIHEWLRLVGRERKEFWVVGLPTALYDLLGSWDNRASVTACIAFLEKHGYEVKEIKK